MSENRRNRRNKRKDQKEQQKSNITRRDKVYGILAVVLLFIIATILVLISALA